MILVFRHEHESLSHKQEIVQIRCVHNNRNISRIFNEEFFLGRDIRREDMTCKL